jgi:hypothetical protein
MAVLLRQRAPIPRGIAGELKPGDDRIRTGDLLVANQPLSHLSYVPGDDFGSET